MAERISLVPAVPGESKEHADRSTSGQRTDGIFVGRERELAELRAALADAHAGRGHLYLLAGEPGIGKTRTAEEFARYARQRDTHVLLGRCYEGEGAPPFWPWVQIVRLYLSSRDSHTVRAEMGLGATDIAQIIPEVRECLPDLSSPPDVAPEAARFRFFDSLTRWLKNIAHRQPLLLILDDLHWADTQSLSLLQFVARDLQDARVLIIATYRDLELGIRQPLTLALGEFARIPGSRNLLLQGLTPQETGRFLELATGVPPTDPLVVAVQQGTEGNPFFVSEVVRTLVAQGRQETVAPPSFAQAIPLPQRVRGALALRLQGLSEECRGLLSVAAVIGKEFRLEVLRQLAGMPQFAVQHVAPEVLDEALQAHVLVTVPQAIGRYSFAHTLLRETLYEELTPSRRVQLHRSVGEVLETLDRTDLELLSSPRNGQVVEELAHHFFVAIRDEGVAAKALLYARRAGERAMAGFAYEEAAAHYARALQALEFQRGSEEQRGELLLALGEAQSRAGSIVLARATFEKAAEVARLLGQPVLLARAALGFAGALVTPGGVDAATVHQLEEALDALGEDDSTLRAQILARLAMELHYSDARARRLRLSEQAVTSARRLGEKSTLAVALNARHYVIWGTEQLEERLAIAAEMVSLAEEDRNRELELLGLHWRAVDLLEQGTVLSADQAIAAHARLAEELLQPYHLFYNVAFGAMRALLAGRFVEGEHLIEQMRAHGQRAQLVTETNLAYEIQMLVLRLAQGRVKDLEAAWEQVEQLIERHPRIQAFQILRTEFAVALGREDEARRLYRPVAEKNFVDLALNLNLLGSAASLARVCVFLGDVPGAAVLYQLLSPYAERCILLGPAIGCLGPVSFPLGLLATALGRWDEAQTHFEAALRQNTRLGARPFIAQTQYEYACMLITRAHTGDTEQAQGLLEQALATARELGMAGLAVKIEGQVSSPKFQVPSAEADTDEPEAGISSALTPDLGLRTSDSQPPAPIFRAENDLWTIAYQGTTFHLKNVRGLRYIAHLLRHPYKKFHALDLVAVTLAGATEQPVEEQAVQPQTAIPSQLRDAYRQQLNDLQDELEEAREFHDPERAARAQEEIDRLVQQLATEMKGDKPNRQAAARAERARINVLKGITSVLAKIAVHSPALELYLSTTLKTGVFCTYTPDPHMPVPWQW